MLLNSVILHLRYPNAHTHWFISLFLHLFMEIKNELFSEIATRVLLERFIVHRPHPWGALVTFIELLRNPRYGFWDQKFVTAVPEVAVLLQSVRVVARVHPSPLLKRIVQAAAHIFQQA
jgi:CCR4-NOT transcription complex subunit 1